MSKELSLICSYVLGAVHNSGCKVFVLHGGRRGSVSPTWVAVVGCPCSASSWWSTCRHRWCQFLNLSGGGCLQWARLLFLRIDPSMQVFRSRQARNRPIRSWPTLCLDQSRLPWIRCLTFWFREFCIQVCHVSVHHWMCKVLGVRSAHSRLGRPHRSVVWVWTSRLGRCWIRSGYRGWAWYRVRVCSWRYHPLLRWGWVIPWTFRR